MHSHEARQSHEPGPTQAKSHVHVWQAGQIYPQGLQGHQNRTVEQFENLGNLGTTGKPDIRKHRALREIRDFQQILEKQDIGKHGTLEKIGPTTHV